MGLIPSFTVQMDIYDVLYLSYIIPEERLQPAVPDNIRLASPVQGKAIISLVIFRCKNVTASLFPFVHYNYDQVNLRTYVIDPPTGKNAVFFLKSGITSRFISVITNLLQIPWQSVSLSLDTRYDNEGGFAHYAVEGNWDGAFNIVLNANRDPAVNPKPFNALDEAIRFLTGPAVGFYATSRGLIRFEVKHSEISPAMGVVSSVHLPMLPLSGFVMNEELWRPDSVLVAPDGHFTIYMPPTRLCL
jgi:Uncharacterized conserved protein (COG2071)